VQLVQAVTFLTKPVVHLLAGVVAPFQIFEAGLLNVLFLAAIGIMVYNMLVLAPRQ
jgi:hypothetical protein